MIFNLSCKYQPLKKKNQIFLLHFFYLFFKCRHQAWKNNITSYWWENFCRYSSHEILFIVLSHKPICPFFIRIECHHCIIYFPDKWIWNVVHVRNFVRGKSQHTHTYLCYIIDLNERNSTTSISYFNVTSFRK